MDGLGKTAALVGIVAGVCAIAAFIFDYWPDSLPDVGGGGSSAFCDNPDLSLSTGSGPSGTIVVVTGTGFLSDEEIELAFHTDSLTPAQSDSEGRFEQQVRIPGSFDFAAPQQFDIRARVKACSERATFLLTDG